jgi:DNA-binding CsgD family transcriptional regulator
MAEPMPASSTGALMSMIAKIGEKDFFDHVIEVLCAYAHCECGEVMRYSRTEGARSMAQKLDFTGRVAGPEAYFDHFYAEDPLYLAFRDDAPPGFYLTAELAKAYPNSRYYSDFLPKTNLGQEISFLMPEQDGWAVVVWVGRYAGSAPFAPVEMDALEVLEPLLRSCVQRHVAMAGYDASTDAAQAQFQKKLDAAFEQFASTRLTERERQVLRYTLFGYSAALTGERLGISEGTVKNHRKAIHRKLEISSRAELFSLFLQCLPYAGGDSGPDPLARVEQGGRR